MDAVLSSNGWRQEEERVDRGLGKDKKSIMLTESGRGREQD